MPDLTKHTDIPFSEFEIDRARKVLQRLEPSRLDAIEYSNLIEKNKYYGKEFDGEKISKSYFDSCTFSEISFRGTAGISCSFRNCILLNCIIREAGFEFSDFHGARFSSKTKGGNVSSSSFSYADFSGSKIENTEFRGCNFDSSYFNEAYIRDTNFVYCNFENAIFDATGFSNVNLQNAGIDYANFRNVEFENTTLPFVGLLHSFGGLQSAEHYKKEISIKFPSGNGEFSFEYFLDIFEELKAYFYSINDFFALSTMSIFHGENDAAYSYIFKGIGHSIAYRDFRMIGYYSKLASLNHFFTRDQLRALYEGLRSEQIAQSMSEHEYNSYVHEIDRIRRLLIDRPFGLPQIIISVETAIDSNNMGQVSNMTLYLNTIISLYLPQSSNYVSIRHNSPFLFEIVLSDSIVALYDFAIILSTSIFGLTAAISRIQKLVYEHHRIKGLKLDNENKVLTNELAKIDIEIKKERSKQSGSEESLPIQKKTLYLPSSLSDQVILVRMSASADIKIDNSIRELIFRR